MEVESMQRITDGWAKQKGRIRCAIRKSRGLNSLRLPRAPQGLPRVLKGRPPQKSANEKFSLAVTKKSRNATQPARRFLLPLLSFLSGPGRSMRATRGRPAY